MQQTGELQELLAESQLPVGPEPVRVPRFAWWVVPLFIQPHWNSGSCLLAVQKKRAVMTVVTIHSMAQNLNVAIKLLARDEKTFFQVWLIGFDRLMRCFFRCVCIEGHHKSVVETLFYTFTSHMVTWCFESRDQFTWSKKDVWYHKTEGMEKKTFHQTWLMEVVMFPFFKCGLSWDLWFMQLTPVSGNACKSRLYFVNFLF